MKPALRFQTRYSRQKQNGSILIIAAIALSTIVIVLASIDIGYLFYQKRELQKIADMASMAGAQQLAKGPAGNRCAGAMIVARSNAASAHAFNDPTTVSCGLWDPVRVASEPHFLTFSGGVVPGGNPDANAIMVQVEKRYTSFFRVWDTQLVVARAIATIDSPTAVFSVGSRLLSIRSNGTVPLLLKAVGADISGTDLASYTGLVNVPVRTDGLLKALGFDIPVNVDIATLKSILQTSSTSSCSNGACSLGALLGAISTVGGQQSLAGLLKLPGDVLGLQVKLLNDANGRGLLALLDTANGKAALESQLQAFDLLNTALGVANSRHFKDLTTQLNVPGVAGVTTKLGIVEAPSIGIGGVGTTAFTAQVRLFSRVQTSQLTNNLLKVDLPIVVDVINGHGTITRMCDARDAQGRDTATIAVDIPMLRACVGQADTSTIFSRTDACNVTPSPTELVNVLNGTLRVSSSFALNGLPNSGEVTLARGQTATVGTNSLQIGTTVINLLKAVLAGTLGKLLETGQGSVTNDNLATGLLNATSNTLATATQTLDTSLRNLRTFVNGLDNSVKAILGGSLSTGVINLLNSVGSLLTGLLTSIGNLLNNLLGAVGCALSGNYNQCALAKELSGTQGSGTNAISNVLLSLMGLLESALAPVLDALGTQLATTLNDLFGIQLGQVDVTLIDLNCGGGDHVRLVH